GRVRFCSRNPSQPRSNSKPNMRRQPPRSASEPLSWVIVGPFLASSLLTVLGGVMVMSQLGIGDPNQGVEYTLGSVAAVLLTLCAVAVYSQAAIIQSKSL